MEAAFANLDASGVNVTLQFIEVGNEADLYMNHGLRSQSFNVAEYTQQYVPTSIRLGEF
jgi:hypothetical protein